MAERDEYGRESQVVPQYGRLEEEVRGGGGKGGMGRERATKVAASRVVLSLAYGVVVSSVTAVLAKALAEWALGGGGGGGGGGAWWRGKTTGAEKEGGVEREHVVAARQTVVYPPPPPPPATATGADESSCSSPLDAIGGLEEVKRSLRRSVVLPLKYPNAFTLSPVDGKKKKKKNDDGSSSSSSSHSHSHSHILSLSSLRPPVGVLLHGPPGTGKTTLVRALAAEAGVPVVEMRASSLESKWWGESVKLLAAAFSLAREELAPCVVFFDEIDGMGRARSDADQSCVYTFKCELLRNMDSLSASFSSGSPPVVVMGCTNNPSSLDPALARRFTKKIEVGVPNEAERLDVLRKTVVGGSGREEGGGGGGEGGDDERRKKGEKKGTTTKKRIVGGRSATEGREEDETLLRKVAERTSGWTGADLVSLHARVCEARLFEGGRVERGLKDGSIRTPSDLARTVGGTEWKHWEPFLPPASTLSVPPKL